MHNRLRILLPVSLLSLWLVSCENVGGTGPKEADDRYSFPDGTIVHDIEDDACFDGYLDKGIHLGRKLQDMALDAASEPVTPEMEEHYGEIFHEEVKKNFSFVEDKRLSKLKKIYKKLKPFVQRQDLDYRVFLIESEDEPEMVNAFTHVGGYIYFTTGLVEFAESEDELAFIMGHELGHNENRHVDKSVQELELGNQYFGEEGMGRDIYSAVMNIVLASFNQPQELVADRAGMYLAFKGGYDPEKGLEFFRRLAKKETQSDLAKIFSTHPYSDLRDRCGMAYLKKAEKKH